MNKRRLLLPLFLSMFAVAGCESGETVHQDTSVRTRSDGTKIKTEEKSSTPRSR